MATALSQSERAALTAAHAHALDYLDSLERRPVRSRATNADLRAALGGPLPSRGVPARQVVDELAMAAEPGQLGSTSGRFFAWVIGGALPSALTADWLASTWDVNACLNACGPAAGIVEEVAGTWTKSALGLPADASFALTTGCQMAHVTCLAAARHRLLRGLGHDVEAKGLFGAPPIRILATGQHHGSIQRALRLLGIGCGAIETLAGEGLDAQGAEPGRADLLAHGLLREAEGADDGVSGIYGRT
jgi:glutamate/tyrosine decarboxylase-like PLP-dependent enzyme